MRKQKTSLQTTAAPATTANPIATKPEAAIEEHCDDEDPRYEVKELDGVGIVLETLNFVTVLELVDLGIHETDFSLHRASRVPNAAIDRD